MKLWNNDVAVVLATLTCGGLAAWALYADFQDARQAGRGQRIGVVVYRQRVAQRKPTGQVIWQSLEGSGDLYNNDTLRTAENSSAHVRLEDGTELRLGENTLLMLSSRRAGMDIDFVSGNIFAQRTAGVAAGKVQIRGAGAQLEMASATISMARAQNELKIDLGAGKVTVERGDEKSELSRDSGFQRATIGTTGLVASAAPVRLLAPTDLSYFLNDENNREIEFAWDMAESGAKEINLEIARDAAMTQIVRRTALKSSGYKARLPGGKYFWRVLSPGQPASVVWSFSVLADGTAQPLAPAPDAAIVSAQARPFVLFQWASAANAAGFTLEIAPTQDFGAETLRLESHSAQLATDKLGEGTWYWRVRARYPFVAGGVETVSEARRLRIRREAVAPRTSLLRPAADETLGRGGLRAGNVLFNWETDGSYSDYEIQFAAEADFREILNKTRVKGNFARPKLNIGGDRGFWRVRPVGENGAEFPFTAGRSFSIAAARPLVMQAPQDGERLFLSAADSGVPFAWQDPDLHGNYELLLFADANAATEISRTHCKQPATSLTLEPGRYYWRVRRVAEAGDAVDESAIRSFFLTGRLPAPGELSPDGNPLIDVLHRASLDFQWRPVPEADRYILRLYMYNGDLRKLLLERVVTGNSWRLVDFRYLDEGNFLWTVEASAYRDGELWKKGPPASGYFGLRLGVKPQADPIEIVTPGVFYVE